MTDQGTLNRVPPGAPAALATDPWLIVAAAYREYRTYTLTVLARGCGWLDAGEREAVLHDAVVVMLENVRAGILDVGALAPGQLRAYLVRTALNKAFDQGKRAERRRVDRLVVAETLARVPDPRPGPQEEAEAHQEASLVRAIVAELPPRQRAVVGLRHFLGLTPAEIQEHLKLTRRTYRRQLERAKGTISRRYSLACAGD